MNNTPTPSSSPQDTPGENDIAAVKRYLQNLQRHICDAFEQLDGQASFQRDSWQREQGGGGVTMVLRNGRVFEQAGVAFSHIHGPELPKPATAARPELAGCGFQAMGVSLVIHPNNPLAPTSHMNIRLFIAEAADKKPIWWFGGGYDLTPYYPFLEDIRHWHQTAKSACEPFGAEVYPEYKSYCDRYFYLRHRDETRGVGGLFFDDLNHWPFATSFDFLQAVGDSYLPAYLPIVEQREQQPYTQQQRDFQLYRRGRYVEFNLLYDRGTLFGLQSDGRTESILMSLPPLVSWRYNWQPEADSQEAQLYKCLSPRDWLAAESI